jgi:hypothetical protein
MVDVQWMNEELAESRFSSYRDIYGSILQVLGRRKIKGDGETQPWQLMIGLTNNFLINDCQWDRR